jgi:FdhD protein
LDRLSKGRRSFLHLSMSPGLQEVNIVRVGATAGSPVSDVAAAEEPLELRLGGEAFVVIMRTPGSDRDLAAGFLLSEQIVQSRSDVSAMRYCTDRDGRDAANVLSVWLQGEAVVRARRAMQGRRHVTANSSCGVCGRRSIDDLMTGSRRVNGNTRIGRAVIDSLPSSLRAAQEMFKRTGGLHAAGLFDCDGRLLYTAEDVGRHNAVDKVIGAALMKDEVPLSNRVLFVSGRTSFEIVHKAVVAGIPVVAAVSAPSSLAVELACESGVTLLGFVRDGSFNIYSGKERIAL